MPSSVRARVTLISTTVVALALLLASLLIVRVVESDLIDATERALAAELELEAAFFDFDGEPEFFEFNADGQFYGLGVFLEDDGLAFGSIFQPDTGEAIAEVVIDTEVRISIATFACGVPTRLGSDSATGAGLRVGMNLFAAGGAGELGKSHFERLYLSVLAHRSTD